MLRLGSREWQATQARYMRSPRVASPGSAIARPGVSKSSAIAKGWVTFIVDLHRFLGCHSLPQDDRTRVPAAAERISSEHCVHARSHIFREMSDPRRSEGRTARLRSEWIGGKLDRHARKGRGEYDDRRRSAREAEALQGAGCHGCAVVHDLRARIGL